MTPGQRIREIMREERERTAEQVAALDPRIAEDVLDLFMAVQKTVNQFVGERDRVIDRSVLATVLDLTRDEISRIAKRLDDAGLTP